MSWLHSVQFSAKGRVQNSDPLLSRQTKKNSSALAQKDHRQESFSVLSDATVTMLIALKDAAVIAPVPYIGEAVGLAIGIWKNVQTTRNTKTSLKYLGQDACNIVYTVLTVERGYAVHTSLIRSCVILVYA
ncbi:MAG: hypothetical protein NXY57DRAFT_1032392 [Lentinula lateritia]|uniref:Uncharacterized protein n=1 Tax=Lentinula lateritia TaxID=40482 RepID=A0ABQ8V2Q0_9AGAR|nr:MAG: hypothetical protein NXY57DRAFT_1032392 [Lentinula lateritia]KAJ4471010.1 hypothetical protein C8R41DRAFT_851520 [Lentinula lateritia]